MKKLLTCLLIYLIIISFVIAGCSNNENEVQVLNGKINNLKEQIKDNNNVINDLNKKIEDKDNKIKESQEEITKLQEEIKYLQEKEQNNSEEKNYIAKYGITEDGRIFGISGKQYHPIVLSMSGLNSNEYGGGTVLGGSVNGRWISLNDFVLPKRGSVDYLEEYDIDLVKGGEEFKMYSPTSYITTVTGSKPRYAYTPSSGTHDIWNVFNESFEAEGNATVGVSGDWDVLPRIPVPLKEVQGYSIDLDNDGIDEKVTIEPDPKDSGIVYYFLKKEGQEDIKFGTSYAIGDWISWREMLFADLNGDGRMEIVLASRGHNTSIGIYEYKEQIVERVLSYYEGD